MAYDFVQTMKGMEAFKVLDPYTMIENITDNVNNHLEKREARIPDSNKEIYKPKSAEERRIEQERIESMEKSIKSYREAHK
jgi:hypothetical protein